MTAKSLERLLCNCSHQSIVIITNNRAGDEKQHSGMGAGCAKGNGVSKEMSTVVSTQILQENTGDAMLIAFLEDAF